MFDLFDKPEFCVVFDYKCDIEIHFSERIEFYQIKTHKVQEPYTFTKISRKNNAGKSVIGQLYCLSNYSDSGVDIKVALVSNAFLKIKDKVYSEYETIVLSDLDQDVQEIILKALKKENAEMEIDLSKISYIYTSMDLLNPENAIRGKIVKCFEQIKGSEPLKPNALYRLIVDTAQEKACYELVSSDYTEIICNKGFMKTELNKLLDKYADKEDACVDETKKYIESLNKGVRATQKLKSALVSICGELITSKDLKSKEINIVSYINKHIEELPEKIEEMAAILLQVFEDSFGIEYSKEQRYIFMILIIKRWEDNKYE